MIERALLSYVALSLLVIVAGCATHPSYPTSYRNKPLYPEPESEVPRAIRLQEVPRARTIREGRRNPPYPDFFLGVGISGGGSRAASFGASVLEKLDQLGILDHVTAVSSVSGGSLPSAYFALNGESIPRGDWSEVKRLMREDFLRRWARRALSPVGLLRSATSDHDRSDEMAGVFDEVLFKGKTFGDLGSPGKRRPALLVNATNISAGGARFTFTEPFFDDLMSDLASYPIAWAVMASGAFPGVFNNVTLKRHWRNVRSATGQPVELFTHLFDGGPGDNLGLDALAEIAQNAAIETVKSGRQFRGCFFILIDAHAAPQPKGMYASDLRSGFIEHVVDFNFLDAIDTMLAERRRYQLADMGILVSLAQQHYGVERRRIGSYRLFSDAGFASRNGKAFTITTSSNLQAPQVWNPLTPGARSYRVTEQHVSQMRNIECPVWHVALNDFHTIPPYRGPALEDLRDQPRIGAPIVDYRGSLRWFVAKVPTNYYLTGIVDHDAAGVQRLLDAAAHVATYDDEESRWCACQWVGHLAADEQLLGPCQATMRPRAELLPGRNDWARAMDANPMPQVRARPELRTCPRYTPD